ncbi:MAG: hypothetical protein DRQ55_02400 [Planctomycetota bacterium]|nr:MAG: hypothetical protein DRQ55_02400 [Planctomycetota bacterium]
MKIPTRSTTSILAIALAVLLGSCNITGASPGDDSQEVAATLDPRIEWLANYATEEGAAPVAMDAMPVHVSAPAVQLDDEADRARLAASLADDRLATLVEGFVDEGLMALERGEAERAHDLFASAVQLDPTHEVARDLYQRTAALAGDDDATLGALAADARTLTKVRRQQRGMDIEHHLSMGRQGLANDDPEAALRHFEDALTLIRFNPDMSRNAATEDEVLALVRQAQLQRESQLAARDNELQRRALQAQEEWDNAERNRTTIKIQGLLASANDAFLRDDFVGAIESLDEALRLDPANTDAEDLRRIATKASHEAAARDIRRAYRKQWNRTFDDLKYDSVIPNDVITFPNGDKWAQTVARGPKSFASSLGGRPADDRAVLDQLDEIRIPYEFDGNTLPEVLAYLRDVTGVNFLMSSDVLDEADNQDYSLRDRTPQSVSRILKIVLEDQSVPAMTFTVRDGIARIITLEESHGDYVLEMYDIRDLTFTPTDHSTLDFNLLPSGTDSESFTDGVEDEEPLPLVSADTLLSLIQDNIAPLTWQDDPERSITQMPGTLIVRQTPDVHEQIHSLLTDLRANTTTLIHIQTRFIEVEDSFLEDIGVDLRGLDPSQGSGLDDFGQPGAGGVGTPANPEGIGTGIDPGAFYSGSNGDLKGRTENLFDSVLGESDVLTGGGGMSIEALFLKDTNVSAVMRAVSKYQNSNIVNAPSLTLRSGQRGNIKVLDNRTYVRDFEPEIATGAVIAQPELDVVKSGIVLDVRAVASADRRFITLELRPTIATLVPDANGNLLPEALVSLGTPNANNVIIQLPELAIQRLRTTATLPDGATLLLGGLKTTIEQDFDSGMPFLSDIPLVSFFFSRQGEYTSRRKLLILLTANIVAPEEHEPILR